MTYTFLPHTADLGIHVQAGTVEELFAEAGRALTAALIENPEEIIAKCQRKIELSASRLDDLLYDWLAELLYIFDSQRLVFRDFLVHVSQLDGAILEAIATGEPLDRTRHVVHLEIKAITYHRLRVEQTPEGYWEAEVIVDL